MAAALCAVNVVVLTVTTFDVIHGGCQHELAVATMTAGMPTAMPGAVEEKKTPVPPPRSVVEAERECDEFLNRM